MIATKYNFYGKMEHPDNDFQVILLCKSCGPLSAWNIFMYLGLDNVVARIAYKTP